MLACLCLVNAWQYGVSAVQVCQLFLEQLGCRWGYICGHHQSLWQTRLGGVRA